MEVAGFPQVALVLLCDTYSLSLFSPSPAVACIRRGGKKSMCFHSHGAVGGRHMLPEKALGDPLPIFSTG